MKKNILIIEETLELFGEKAFYNISFDEHQCNFQGRFHSGIVARCMDWDKTFTLHGYLLLTKENVSITLTE